MRELEGLELARSRSGKQGFRSRAHPSVPVAPADLADFIKWYASPEWYASYVVTEGRA